MSNEITFRWLEPHELHLVDPIVAAHSWITLNEWVSRVLVAEEDGTIVGFVAFQLTPQVGPFYVHPEYRGSKITDELAKRMRAFLDEVECRGYFAVADNPHVSKLCKAQGMARMDSPVFVMIPEKEQEDMPHGRVS
jgi:N-acetylglutamate synthase-like GNAT family acetyltransferase